MDGYIAGVGAGHSRETSPYDGLFLQCLEGAQDSNSTETEPWHHKTQEGSMPRNYLTLF